MRTRFIIFLVLIIPLFFWGSKCRKTDNYPPPKDTLFVNDTFLRYWYFKEGSWWIYKRIDTTAEVYDTVVLTSTFHEINPFRSLSVWCEGYWVHLYHQNKYFYHPNSDTVQTVGNSLLGTISMNSVNSSCRTGFFNFDMFLWPIEYNYMYPKNTQMKDTFSIKLSKLGWINNTVHMKNDLDGEERWVARDIGFIKYVFTEKGYHEHGNSVWELVDYNIKK